MQKHPIDESGKTAELKIEAETDVSICRKELLRNEETSSVKNNLSESADPNSCPKCGLDTFPYQTVSGYEYRRCFHCGHRDMAVSGFQFTRITILRS